VGIVKGKWRSNKRTMGGGKDREDAEKLCKVNGHVWGKANW